jgi:hypothetical protein
VKAAFHWGAMLLAAVLTVAAAKKPAAPPPAETKSDAIVAVDIQNLTFKFADKSGSQTVYNVTIQTEIVVNGKPAKIEDLKKGMAAKVASSDGKNADRVEARGGLPPIKPTPKKKK